jgi:Amt family ammonium transporter
MYDTGTTAFMILGTMLVFLMTPALAFFYGGLSRRKNVVNTMFMSVAVIGVVGVIWIAIGWSLAYGGDGTNPFIGGFNDLFLNTQLAGVINPEMAADEGVAAGADAYGTYPALIDVAFQAAFAIITMAIITGALAGRMKFGALLAFIAIWCVLVYAPLAHMVWGGEHSFIGGMIGALDFAGGDVVHISSGLAGLILCIILGKRRGYGMLSYRPHNVPFVVLGAGLLWFGWFGFNSASAFVADGIAALALVTTIAAPAAAMLSWMVTERIATGKATLVGGATGILAGLVVITPAAGFVEPWAAVLMGLIVSPICYLAIAFVKHKLGYDDALDAFGVHGVGGIVGGVLTGIFCVPGLSWTDFGGLWYTGDLTLLGAQVLGILVTIAFVGVLTMVIGLLVKALFKGSLRVDESIESEGMDATVHGESAYPAYNGLD